VFVLPGVRDAGGLPNHPKRQVDESIELAPAAVGEPINSGCSEIITGLFTGIHLLV
jgi:hypothetical protein